MPLIIQKANLDASDFQALIDAHAELMLTLSPPGSCHFLHIEGLRDPTLSVWEVRDEDTLVGCGGLKELSKTHGEIKSMHTLAAKRGAGLGRMMLEHVVTEARKRGYERLSLETGSMDGFKPSRTLYLGSGFEVCPPFGDYIEDPNSVFMTRSL